MTAVEYLERRVKELQMEQPQTTEGRIARDAAIHELHNCIFGVIVQAMNTLHQAQLEAGLQ